MKTRRNQFLHDVAGALVVLAVIAGPTGADWTMDAPAEDEEFDSGSNVAGEGEGPGVEKNYVFRVRKNSSTTLQSASGTAEASWEKTLSSPSGGWPVTQGTSVRLHAEVVSGGMVKVSNEIEVSDEEEE